MLAVLLLGSSLVTAAMSVFLFGCCVLPFHRYVHRIMPLCGGIVRGLGHGRGHDGATPATPARRAAAVAKAITARAPQVTASASAGLVAPAAAIITPRSFMTLGALRCDDDVGLHLLLTTLRI